MALLQKLTGLARNEMLWELHKRNDLNLHVGPGGARCKPKGMDANNAPLCAVPNTVLHAGQRKGKALLSSIKASRYKKRRLTRHLLTGY